MPTIENNNCDTLHEVYSRADDRMTYNARNEPTPFTKEEVLQCIAHELIGIRIVLEKLVQ